MLYEWDPAKNRANLAKHGVDFADAVAVFEDDLALTRPDPASRGESRFVTLKLDAFGRHLVVVFTERGARVRIISVRLATKLERKAYEACIRLFQSPSWRRDTGRPREDEDHHSS